MSTESIRQPLSAVNAVLVGVIAGFVVGVLTSPLQGWLADSVSSLANPAGTWSLAAFLVARRSPNVAVGAVVAFGVVSGVLIGEGIYGLAKISDTTDWRYWATEIVVAVSIVGLVALRNRSVVVISSCIGMTAAAAAVVYCVAISA